MEPIIKGPIVASETRKLSKPAMNPGKKTGAVADTISAGQGITTQFAEESNLHVRQAAVDVSHAKPSSGDPPIDIFSANEKALAEAKALAEKMGFAAGMEKGEEAVKNSMAAQMERFSSIAASLHQAKATVLESSEDAIVEVVYAAVCQIVGTAAVSPSVIADTVRRVAALARDRERLTVRLHPDDFDLMQKIFRPTGSSITEEQIDLQPDTMVQLGGCIVDSSKGSLDARLEFQFARLREALIEARNTREKNEEPI